MYLSWVGSVPLSFKQRAVDKARNLIHHKYAKHASLKDASSLKSGFWLVTRLAQYWHWFGAGRSKKEDQKSSCARGKLRQLRQSVKVDEEVAIIAMKEDDEQRIRTQRR